MKKETKLPKVFKTKWLQALRSGKYKQGIDKLETIDEDGNTSYCCLGVACKMLYPELMIGGEVIYNNDIYKKIPTILIGDAVANKLVEKLATMNDGQGDFNANQHSFKQIADWIEKNL